MLQQTFDRLSVSLSQLVLQMKTKDKAQQVNHNFQSHYLVFGKHSCLSPVVTDESRQHR